jgi:hypothetical protein
MKKIGDLKFGNNTDGGGSTYITKDEAVKLIAHLQKVFKLELQQ